MEKRITIQNSMHDEASANSRKINDACSSHIPKVLQYTNQLCGERTNLVGNKQRNDNNHGVWAFVMIAKSIEPARGSNEFGETE